MKKKEKEEMNWQILGLLMGFILVFIGVVIGLNIQSYPSIQDVCLECNRIYGGNQDYTVNNIDVLIDKINADCGTTHITKQYGSNEWSVFKKINKDGWEKTEYVLISECLERS